MPGFIAGGALPPARRGGVMPGLVSVVDFYATLAEAAGLTEGSWRKELYLAPAPLDTLSIWSYLTGDREQPPRDELVLGHEMPTVGAGEAAKVARRWRVLGNKKTPEPIGSAIIVVTQSGLYKLLLGVHSYASWHGAFSPNGTKAQAAALPQVKADCGTGCLYDLEQVLSFTCSRTYSRTYSRTLLKFTLHFSYSRTDSRTLTHIYYIHIYIYIYLRPRPGPGRARRPRVIMAAGCGAAPRAPARLRCLLPLQLRPRPPTTTPQCYRGIRAAILLGGRCKWRVSADVLAAAATGPAAGPTSFTVALAVPATALVQPAPAAIPGSTLTERSLSPSAASDAASAIAPAIASSIASAIASKDYGGTRGCGARLHAGARGASASA